MSGDRIINVKRPKTPVGKTCMHCTRRATVTATRKTKEGRRMRVTYCDHHYDEAVRRLT